MARHFSEPFRELPVAERGRLAAAKLVSHLRLRRWPQQSDHLAIDESRLLQLMSALFSVRDRYWARGYLTFDLSRI